MRKPFIHAVLGAALLSASSQVMANETGVCKAVVPTAQAIRATLHANYLPNFIPMIVNSEKELNLTAEQCRTFNKFRSEKAVKGKQLIEKINKMEQESRVMALQGESLEVIKQRHAKIAELREKLVEGKMKCHQFVKKVLSAEQYAKLVKEIYPQMRTKAMEIINVK
ncbi:hypothetical protein [Thiomicrorhabdus xiamenensis]|uniref:LTXXQ motif family protein n=1 Tax=Thiomicrorhabdus xiamenensis TaxID=2739063 RepID=A0A7D4TAS4_9GAMM|nr:hypothetical protein [Thiomicrorhabdus xiamenensis]QKI89286.1 hypothetical protein HQN79_06760 [Thiomicrorhabdus xiamenensis]